MKPFATLSLVLFFTSAYALPAASGNFTLSLTEVKGIGAYLKGAADAGRARAAFLKGRTPNPTTLPLTPARGGRFLVVEVGVGFRDDDDEDDDDPVDFFPLLFFTSSPVTWFKGYTPSKYSLETGQSVHCKYDADTEDGQYFYGIEYKDIVTLAPGVVIEHQSVGSEIGSRGFDEFYGVLGLGPIGLSQGTLDPDRGALVPTVMDNLFAQEKIEKQIFSVYLQPSEGGTAAGSVTFGGINRELYVGDLTYVSVTSKFPSSNNWGIEIACTYGDQVIIPAGTPGIIDTGSSLIYFAKKYYDAYVLKLRGRAYDGNAGLLVVPQNAYNYLQPLNFHIGGKVFTLDRDAQLIPQEQNGAWDGLDWRHYSWISEMEKKPEDASEGFNFILGLPFLRQLYTVYETTSTGNRIGFAKANPSPPS